MFEEILKLYNSKKKPMNLVFFEDALEHLTRIHRTLRLPQVGAVACTFLSRGGGEGSFEGLRMNDVVACFNSCQS